MKPKTRIGYRRRYHIHAAAAVLTMLLPASAAAQLVPVFGGIYGGAGALYTEFDDLSHDSRFGYRLYGGVDLARIPAVLRLGVEGGFTRTGTFRTEAGSERIDNGDIAVQATWTTLPVVDFHARAGYEWGDTSGIHFALGGSASVLPLLSIRAEYQLRNDFNAALLGIELRIP